MPAYEQQHTQMGTHNAVSSRKLNVYTTTHTSPSIWISYLRSKLYMTEKRRNTRTEYHSHSNNHVNMHTYIHMNGTLYYGCIRMGFVFSLCAYGNPAKSHVCPYSFCVRVNVFHFGDNDERSTERNVSRAVPLSNQTTSREYFNWKQITFNWNR